MQVKTRHHLAVLLGGVFLLIWASIGVVSFAQNREGFVTEGESLNDILIGKSTADNVVSAYGNDYKLINHSGYSYELIYKNLGLAFYYCQADPNREIFVIEIQSPAKVITSKGIKLGESSFGDVFKLYGKDDYDGITFFPDEESKDEDSEDARNPSRTENIGLTSGDKGGAESSDVIGENSPSDQEDTDAESLKGKVVKRIEIIEKSGLRQCDSKFPKK